MKLQHQNVENIEQFDKTQAEILRQKKMQYLESDINYQLGFNHAWTAMQGASREAVIDATIKRKLELRIKQLEAECSTLNEELGNLKILQNENQVLAPQVIPPQVLTDVPRETTVTTPTDDVPRETTVTTPTDDVPRETSVPKRVRAPRKPATAKPKPTT